VSEKIDVLENPPLRVVTAPPVAAVEQINQLLKEYQVMSYHWAVVKDELVLSALLIHKSELRKMALANHDMPGFRH
jgi:hypothetical protein